MGLATRRHVRLCKVADIIQVGQGKGCFKEPTGFPQTKRHEEKALWMFQNALLAAKGDWCRGSREPQDCAVLGPGHVCVRLLLGKRFWKRRRLFRLSYWYDHFVGFILFLYIYILFCLFLFYRPALLSLSKNHWFSKGKCVAQTKDGLDVVKWASKAG